MSDYQQQAVLHQSDLLNVKPGQSFAFVSGLGGQEVRDQELYDPWWASVYTSDQNADHGALFCTLNGAEADCYFKDISGTVPDQFSIVNENSVAGASDDSTSTTEPATVVVAEPTPALPSDSLPSTATDIPPVANAEPSNADTANVAGGRFSLFSFALMSVFGFFRMMLSN